MRQFLDSLAVRIVVVCLLGLILLQLVIAAAIVWPDGRPPIFHLVAPKEAAALARALEAAPADLQPLVLEALNSGAMIVTISPQMPRQGSDGSVRDAPHLERIFGRYAAALDGREFRVQIRRGMPFFAASDSEGPVRLHVRLRTGQVMTVERAPVAIKRLWARILPIAVAAGAVLLAVMVVCMSQVAGPVNRLARAAHRFAREIDTPDVPLRGAHEIKELGAAFNEMKSTIRLLIDDRTRILAAIAHDLRTYLTRLRLRAEFIDDSDQRRRAANDIEEMSQLLDDTLMFSRETTAVRRPQPQIVDSRAEIDSFVSVRQELGEPVTDVSSHRDPLPCRCSGLALQRILSNLVDNAIRYGGCARISAWRQDDEIWIAVDDDGPGIPAEALNRITAPFERLEPSRGRRTGGAGLGLAIVRALAESQGGELSISNRSGSGLRAAVRLPAG